MQEQDILYTGIYLLELLKFNFWVACQPAISSILIQGQLLLRHSKVNCSHMAEAVYVTPLNQP